MSYRGHCVLRPSAWAVTCLSSAANSVPSASHVCCKQLVELPVERSAALEACRLRARYLELLAECAEASCAHGSGAAGEAMGLALGGRQVRLGHRLVHAAQHSARVVAEGLEHLSDLTRADSGVGGEHVQRGDHRDVQQRIGDLAGLGGRRRRPARPDRSQELIDVERLGEVSVGSGRAAAAWPAPARHRRRR